MSQNTWIWGTHATTATLVKRTTSIQKIMLTEQSRQKFQQILANYNLSSNPHIKNAHIEVVPGAKMEQMFGRNHQGIALFVRQIKFWSLNEWIDTQDQKSTIIACDLIEDPHNLGAIIRTAAAFKINGILVTKDKQAPFEGTLAKSAAGGLEHIPIVQVVNLANAIKHLQKHFYMAFGLDERGSTDWHICDRNIIVLGQEGKGLRELTRKSCDELISIETNKEFPTLNVSVAAGIAMAKFMQAKFMQK